MKCKYYSEVTDKCAFDGPLDDCPYQDDPSKCNCFEPIVWKGEPTTDNDFMTPEQLKTIMLPNYTARIIIGSWKINLTDKTFTEEQIKNMKEMLGWEVENL